MTNTSTSTAAVTVNYTEAQEAIIAKFAADKGSALNLADATTLAEMPEMFDARNNKPRTVRSVLAKINRMDIDYARKEPVSKDGSAVVQKRDLVTRINKIVEGNLDGLDKAPKPALVAIAAFLERKAA